MIESSKEELKKHISNLSSMIGKENVHSDKAHLRAILGIGLRTKELIHRTWIGVIISQKLEDWFFSRILIYLLPNHLNKRLVGQKEARKAGFTRKEAFTY